MRIGMVFPWLAGSRGTMDYTENMAVALGQEGHEVTLILLGAGDAAPPKRDLGERVDLHFIPLREICGRQVRFPPEIEEPLGGPESFVLQIFYDLHWNVTPPGNEENLQQIVAHIAPILRDNSVKAIQICDFLYALGLPLREVIQKPTAVFVSSYNMWAGYFVRRSLPALSLLGRESIEPEEWYEDFAGRIKQYDAIWTCSQDFAQKMRRDLDIPGEIGLSYCGVWLEEFDPPEEEFLPFPDNKHPRVLFMGRMDPERGAHNLITALPWVLDAYPDTDIHIVGGDEAHFKYSEVIWALAVHLGVEDNVTMWGQIPRRRVNHYLAHSDIFVCPYVATEPGSITPLMAMASYKPLVASDVGINPEIVTPKTGVLYHRCDTRALAEGLIYLLEDDERRIHLGTNARRLVERKFTWPKRARELVELCQAMGADTD